MINNERRPFARIGERATHALMQQVVAGETRLHTLMAHLARIFIVQSTEHSTLCQRHISYDVSETLIDCFRHQMVAWGLLGNEGLTQTARRVL